MPTLTEYAANFPGFAVPPELVKLVAFDTSAGNQFYSDGFELSTDRRGDLDSWSKDPEFVAQLMPFAQATGGGSFYALWLNGTSQDLSTVPVVVFGDEGGVHIVAENLADLLRILTFDAEPSIDVDRVYYYRSDDQTPSKKHDAYVTWLKTELGLEPLEEADAVVESAQAKLKPAFDAWLARYVS